MRHQVLNYSYVLNLQSKHSNVLFHFSVSEAASENVLGKRDFLKNRCTENGQVETAIKNHQKYL